MLLSDIYKECTIITIPKILNYVHNRNHITNNTTFWR